MYRWGSRNAGRSPSAYDSAADSLKTGYLIHNGQLDRSDEGTGQSFAARAGDPQRFAAQTLTLPY
ncbi:hypothetical protein ACPPVO_16615 [Dactylosporangium sp. McL0621]|uniref:hypothetical protein n=1 Tax=Dactylosporangium sp. McL0621 TaxID=3415678 RepID=UPI003CF05171